MKTAIYCRVSTEEQTVENQKIKLIDYCIKNNLEYDIFEETESSRKNRPIKQGLLLRLMNKEYDSVIVYKLDRWARSLTELSNDTKGLIEKGIGFISISENLDFGTATGKLHFHILSAFAEFERAMISERTKAGLVRTRSQGTILGAPKKVDREQVYKLKSDGISNRNISRFLGVSSTAINNIVKIKTT